MTVIGISVNKLHMIGTNSGFQAEANI